VNRFVSFVIVVSFVVDSSLCPRQAAAQSGRSYIPFADARPILGALRTDLLPPQLQWKTPAQLESGWSDWVSHRDADIRARLASGDEDSVITFLLFGVTFTTQPRYSFTAPASRGRTRDAVAADPIIQARIKDMVAGIASPGGNERLQFARQVVGRQGIDPAPAAGREQTRRFLLGAFTRMLAGYDAYFRERSPGSTLFRNRGLSSDTSIYAAFAVDAALNDITSMRAIRAGTVRRVAIVGPGLDFTDKQEGYDFYPLQTIQPFAVIDSLRRLGLGAGEFRMTTYDISPRVNQHLAAAAQRARAGTPYTLQLPRDTAQPWRPDLLAYWKRLGDRIGVVTTPIAPPPALGTIQMRAVNIRPDVVQAITARDLDIILQRPDPLPDSERFDLVIATNILIYYDVFEQSLAMANIAKMLRPGGVLLTNNPLFELPAIPVRQVGETKATYTNEGSDWIAWYQRE
jgi:SAM-dependent methyltransferase